MKSIVCCFFILCFGMALSQTSYNSIPDYKTYKSLKGKPLSDKFSNVESVKVIYDLKNRKLYYFNSTKIKLHYEFVVDQLGYTKDLYFFNADNYSASAESRDFLLGNLNHVKGTEKWVFELAASDHMPIALIEQFYKLVSSSVYIGKKLKFYLNTREKIAEYAAKKFSIPCVASDYIFNDVSYQEVVHGSAVGILKTYTLKQLETTKPGNDEIVIIDGTPEMLPDVKGIIVNELQTPLSHLVILGKNRKIPVMAYTKAIADRRFKDLLNKKVALKIEVDTFYISATNKKMTVGAMAKKRKLELDTVSFRIFDLSQVTPNGAKAIGAKAQNMSYLIAAAKERPIFKVPEYAHAIPFYYYRQHVRKQKIRELIDELLSHTNKNDAQWIDEQLKKIRSAIKKAPIDASLINGINAITGNQSAFKNFRFRSSTNAEDIDGFNGAGLYDSKTGIVGDSVKTFEKAIKEVWASVWNEAPYYEREHFGIDQRAVAMGVLFHRSFPDELANGVVITKNISRTEFPGITVNVQKGENSVVKPEKGEVCEQFTAYKFNENLENFEVDYVSLSNLNKNEPILTTGEINRICLASYYLSSKLRRYWKKPMAVADIEFKIVGKKRELYIKQIRVFND
ncbi:PEP/pyruvate-binding domain-containing protein [Flavobacterium sp.]|uniref:PEP/pyruvate-binding domain-containing protein n=1 Tax=Flavobacterium sp. TaxID=239 RepID=UPI002607E3D4|nr:PEP/pyruvate-binding domain-containing protein [Flavobacterium sp.]